MPTENKTTVASTKFNTKNMTSVVVGSASNYKGAVERVCCEMSGYPMPDVVRLFTLKWRIASMIHLVLQINSTMT
jgi:hypothetical protein